MASHSHRFALRPMVALLFILALFAAPASALASTSEERALAQERYYSSYAAPDTPATVAQEQYLRSYGEPTPIPHPASSGGSSDTWLIVGLSVAAIVLVAGSATQLRRRRAAGSPA